MQEPVGRIMLLTNLATLGHQFNPVSFYFVYDVNDKPLCSVVEVGNTFKEMKPYFIDATHLNKDVFTYRTKKLFYVSPFIAHDVDFDFRLSLPSDNPPSAVERRRTFSCAMAAGAIHAGQGFYSMGSGANMMAITDNQEIASPKLISFIHPLGPQLRILDGVQGSIGYSLRWFRDQLGQSEQAAAQLAEGTRAFAYCLFRQIRCSSFSYSASGIGLKLPIKKKDLEKYLQRRVEQDKSFAEEAEWCYHNVSHQGGKQGVLLHFQLSLQ